MGRRKANVIIQVQLNEQVERGKRIKQIREEELQMNKSQLARMIGISSQFLGLVEDGKGNLAYDTIRLFRDICGHSADYILFGLDDDTIDETRQLLEKYTDEQLIAGIDMLKNISSLIKNK